MLVRRSLLTARLSVRRFLYCLSRFFAESVCGMSPYDPKMEAVNSFVRKGEYTGEKRGFKISISLRMDLRIHQTRAYR